MTKAPVTQVTHGTTGASDHVTLDSTVEAMIDVQVPSGVTAISYTIESRPDDAAEWVTEPKASDETADLTVTDKSFSGRVSGKRRWRVNVDSRTGTGDVVLSITESVHTTN